MMYFLKSNARKKKNVYDPDGIIADVCKLCSADDGKYRSFLLLEACKKYETEFCTNVTKHMFQRVKKYVRALFSTTAKETHEQCFRYYFRGEYLVNNEENEDDLVTELFRKYDLCDASVRADPFAYVPLLFEMQKKRIERNEPLFTVFPVYKQNVKHVTYTTMGLYELLSSLRLPNKPTSTEIRDDPQKYWSRYFTLPKNFGYSIATDGVSVSKSLVRRVQKIKKQKTTETEGGATVIINVNDYEKVVAVDPGAKTPIVTCTKTGEDAYEYKRDVYKRQVYRRSS